MTLEQIITTMDWWMRVTSSEAGLTDNDFEAYELIVKALKNEQRRQELIEELHQEVCMLNERTELFRTLSKQLMKLKECEVNNA